MRRDAVAADRTFAVREAAAAWHKSGTIDEPTRRTIEADYPDDRRRLSLGLRIVACLTTLAGGGAVVALIGEVLRPGDAAVFAVAALLFIGFTELQIGRWRRAQAGTEYATAILGALLACAFLASIEDFRFSRGTLPLFALCWAVAAWRWGFAFFAVIAELIAIGALTDAHHARGGCLVIGAASLTTLLTSHRFWRLAPSHRRALDWSATLGVVAGYAACNVYVLDTLGIEPMQGHVPPADWVRVLAILATALVPPALLALGVLRRHRTLLLLGALTTAASLATIRFYVHVAPLWVVLTLSGTACAGLAVGIKRWLSRGPSKERGGFTAESLHVDRRALQLAQALATIGSLAPKPVPAGERPGFEGGGGSSGGGGAQGRF
ncbi:MAG TPA: hypothetical protein VFV19_02070 [Candidatus Polarisedimenticolaceae bacterium]|nr:hypothetical protein [Candidatus Polarisedimenticolaceae bacterium]